MSDAVTDLNPHVNANLLAYYMRDADIECNGYDHATGPCSGRSKWPKGASKTSFIHVDLIPSGSHLPDEPQEEEEAYDETEVTVALASATFVDNTEAELLQWANEDQEKDPEMQNKLAKFRENFPTDAWGVELPRPPRSGAVNLKSGSFDNDEELRSFNRFPGVVGIHKHVELCHPKLCTLKLATRFAESHGKHGRRKLTHMNYHRA
jgi:hypothetical protein